MGPPTIIIFCPFSDSPASHFQLSVLLSGISDSTKEREMVEDVYIVVRGGDSETVSRLAAKQLPTPDIMQLWGDAVFYNPDFIHKKVTFFTQYIHIYIKPQLVQFVQLHSSCRKYIT